MPKSTAESDRRRSRREGSVYRNGKRADGTDRWSGAITWTDAGGRKNRRMVTGRTAEETRDRLDELRRDLKLGTLAPSGQSVTLGEYFAGWIERRRSKVRPSTCGRPSHTSAYT